MQTPDRRGSVRIPFSSETILRNQDMQFWGSIDNLSTGGAFITIPGKIELGAVLEIEIFLAEPASRISVVLNARVVRHTCVGMAVQFTGMSPDVFKQIRLAVAASSGEKKKAAEEFLKFMLG